MNQSARYAQAIQALYPNLPIENVALNQSGQYNNILFVDDHLIFRFPKVPAAVETLQREVAILNAIQHRLSLPVPNPTYVNLDTTIGHPFVGYPMLPGRPLWREAFPAIHDAAILEQMAHQLATFLRELHSVSAASIPISLPLQDTAAEYENMYSGIKNNLFPHMRPNARRQVAADFEVYLNQPEQYRFEPALRHGDFGTGNLLHDPATGQITAVLDFGSAGLGDPATDFAGLLASFGEPFYRRCARLYPEMESALPRARFYHGTFALQEALFGLENNDPTAFEAGIQPYR